ncbi:unnamed protein product [Ambrosiozyma monospora]|uniref:Unnamed protein product n=1 Tax=Ambrosiozyma monospora TaxID=43982 RepID=A0A9W6YWF9_AMBMO|nr:unnamed protein product [Ambrosiozyma monospora]
MSYTNETAAAANDWVWVADKENTFLKGEVESVSDDEKTYKVKIPEQQNKVRSFKANEVHRCNPVQFDKCDDMASLTHLNEPSVVNNLQLRYQDDLIYTYSGLFLVAVNPYKKLNIYNKDFVKLYKNSTVNLNDTSNNSETDDDSSHLTRSSSVKPHIFATSEEAFQNLKNNKQDQSILVTGESGAGKTETTKKVIQYILQVSTSETNKAASICFENQILQANPILESFGNATTVRNLNSSRFGKFIKINILPVSNELSGCHIDCF